MRSKRFLTRVPLLVVSLLMVLSGFASGGTPASAQGNLFFGQEHAYTVIFRGNGEAITYAKLTVTNPEDTALSELSFEIPRVTPTEIVILQQKSYSYPCLQYDYNNVIGSSYPCIQYDYSGTSSLRSTKVYPDSGIYPAPSAYEKVKYTKVGREYRLTLPQPIEPSQSSAIILAYAAKGYVVKELGLYKFNFETIKVPARIQNVRVSVDVDSELFLKGKRAQVNYQEGFAVSELADVANFASGVASSGVIDRTVSVIGSYGALTKEAKNLAPEESFMVRGEYATSRMRLYLGSILLTLVIIAAFVTGIVFLAKWLLRRARARKEALKAPETLPVQGENTFSILNTRNILVGLLSAALVTGLSLLVNGLTQSNLIYNLNITPAISIIGFIALMFLYLLLMFGPAALVASKHGWKVFLSIVVTEFLWFVVFLVIFLLAAQASTIPTLPLRRTYYD